MCSSDLDGRKGRPLTPADRAVIKLDSSEHVPGSMLRSACHAKGLRKLDVEGLVTDSENSQIAHTRLDARGRTVHARCRVSRDPAPSSKACIAASMDSYRIHTTARRAAASGQHLAFSAPPGAAGAS